MTAPFNPNNDEVEFYHKLLKGLSFEYLAIAIFVVVFVDNRQKQTFNLRSID